LGTTALREESDANQLTNSSAVQASVAMQWPGRSCNAEVTAQHPPLFTEL